MQNRRYSFESTWTIQAPRSKVWQTLTATPFSWSEWWPELLDMRMINVKPEHVGTSVHCIWRAPLGYKLSTELKTLVFEEPEKTILASTGDLIGTATITLSVKGNETIMKFSWQVQSSKPWMNLLAPLLSPIFISNHNRLMASGERGLQRFLHA